MLKQKIIVAIAFSCIAPTPAMSQILKLAELSVRALQGLDRDETVVIMPGGILEEHGPYLPSFSDGYTNAWLADRAAEAIISERGGTVLMFPMIPLGAGPPEGFGARTLFSGSYPVRPETLRAVYMDLASALGDDGFRNIFVISAHGAPSHNSALLDAASYFNDSYGGRMVVLTSILYDNGIDPPEILEPEEKVEHGVSVHAGAQETSELLFVRPALVAADYVTAALHRADTTDDLVSIAERPGWPGYFGSPRLASVEDGARLMEYRADQIIDLALRILDGFDWTSLPTRDGLGDKDDSFRALRENNVLRTDDERRRQERWLESRNNP